MGKIVLIINAVRLVAKQLNTIKTASKTESTRLPRPLALYESYRSAILQTCKNNAAGIQPAALF